MGKFDYSKIQNLLTEMSVATPTHSIQYSMFPLNAKSVYEENGSRLVTVRTNVDVRIHDGREGISFPMDLLKLPHHGETGFIINGKNRQVIDIYTKSYGWYVLHRSGSVNQPHLKLETEQGKNLMIYEKDYQLMITSSKKMNDGEVPLAVFLKAFTGLSFQDLANRLGNDNVYVLHSFNRPEPLKSECVDMVIVNFFDDFKANKKAVEMGNMSIKDRYELALQRLFSPRFMVLGETAGIRMKRALSFKERCRNMYLAEDIFIDGKIYRKDVVLDPRALEELDSLPIDELKVYDGSRKQFIVRKNSIYNFRALGKLLAEDVFVGGVNFPTGTVLDVETLKVLDGSDLSNLIVVDDAGEESVSSRKIYNNNLDVQDILSMTQVFTDTLNGLDCYDNVYELTNQNLVTIEITALNTIKSYCKMFNYYIDQYVNNTDENIDLLTSYIELSGFDTNKLIERITSVEAVESQSAELNNIVQKVSKEHKVTKQGVKQSSVDMTAVRESQFGLLDPIENPESSKIGTVHTKAWLAETDTTGFLSAPYIRVKNGVVQSDVPVYLTAADKADQYIASWEETFFETNEQGEKVKKRMVRAIYNDSMLDVPVDDVTYMDYSPIQTMSPARMQIPFPQHSAPKRMLMGSNHQKQAGTTIKAERPWVSSGGDSLLQEGIIRCSDILSEYYDSNKGLLLDVDKEQFVTSELELVSIDVKPGSKDLYFMIHGFEGHNPIINIPFIQKASSGLMYSYKVKVDKGTKYSGSDIVAHSNDIDTRSYDVLNHTDWGHMKVDPKLFEGQAIATSRNLVIGFKTHEGSTIDDAILINSRLVYNDELTTVDLHRETYKLMEPSVDPEKGTKDYEEFGFVGRSAYPHMGDDGLPKLNSVLKPGDVVIGVRKLRDGLSREEGVQRIMSNNKDKRLEGTVEGMVVSATIEGNEAVVILAALKPIESGDKLAGRYGNKSVIAKIVPPWEMPYDPITGEILDVCMSPLGVPARSNISQVLEMVLGAAMKLQGRIAVISPYKEDSLEFVKAQAKESGVVPRMLRDGRTGRWIERPVLVGPQYMLKLEHMVSHKIRAIGSSNKTDPVFNQPTKGAGHAGGQAFGEYESWCLMGVGATRVLQDLSSVQSDDLPSIEVAKASFMEDPYEVDVVGNNNNDDLFQVITRSLCIEGMVDDNGDFMFKPLTDSMIRGMNTRPVDITDKDSLRSTYIFGATRVDRSRFENRKMWSWMPLYTELVHPQWITKGKINNYLVVGRIDKDNPDKVLIDVCQMSMLKELVACKYYIEKEMVKGEEYFVFKRGDVEGRLTGFPALVKILREYDLQLSKDYFTAKIARAKKTTTKMIPQRQLRTILDFEEAGCKLTDFIISSLPVMPLSFRPQAMFKNSFQDFDYYYRRIIDEVSKYRDLGKEDPISIYNIYLRIVELCGLTYGKEIKENKSYTSILSYFAQREGRDKKHGRIRENMLKKRVRHSGRTVIIPSSDTKRLPTSIGIPFLMCIDMWKPQLVSVLMNECSHFGLDKSDWEKLLGVMGGNLTAFKDKVASIEDRIEKTSTEIYDIIYGVIQTYIEGYTDPVTGEVVIKPRVVLAGRQPSLHKFNIRAYTVVITSGKCIEIHPLVCKGYNADFDGDQMWIIALINEAACVEALEKMSPKFGIINPKDNSVVLDHSQDMKLGIYYATMLHNNVDDIRKDSRYGLENLRFYSSLDRLTTDIDLEYLKLQDLVIFTKAGKKYLSTAGRVLLNGLIPGSLGFTDEPFSNPLGIEGINVKAYNDLKFDGLVSGNGGKRNTPVYVALGDITYWSYETFDPDNNIKLFQAISEFGFKYSDYSGISLYLEDFIEPPGMQGVIAKAEKLAIEINNWYYAGVISGSTRKNLLIEIYNGCKSTISKTFVASFDRNNNMFIMFDSGARGTEGQLMQACGIIGILQKTKNETLEVPVLSSYARGNSAYDTLLLSFSTRTGVANTQQETATSGELTRTAVYMSSGFKIVEEDCGFGFEKWKLNYAEFTDKVLTPSGEYGHKSVLVGKQLVGDDLDLPTKIARNFLGVDGLLTERCVELFIKHKVKTVRCTDGEYKLYYKLDSRDKSMLLRREAKELPTMIYGKYISSSTLNYIEKHNLEYIYTRTMLGCKSVGGVCAHCYGLRYDANVLPEVGDHIGIESAQSIGEPAAQLTMSLFHQGGVAGASIDQGVSVLSSLLQSGKPSKVVGATIPYASGYVYYNPGDNNIKLIQDDGEEIMLTADNEIIVENGEYVEYDTPLTTGFIVPLDIEETPAVEVLRFKQLALLELYFRTFEMSNIKVNARHFEIFVRLQTSLATITESDNEKFKVGLSYELNDIIRNGAGSNIEYAFDISNSSEVIVHYGGMVTEMARERLADNLGEYASRQVRTKGKSHIGSLMYGQDVTGSRTKVLSLPTKIRSVREEVVVETSKLREFEGSLAKDLIQEVETEDITLSADLDALLDFGDYKPQNDTAEDYIVLEDEKEEEVGSKAPELDKMKLF